MITEIIAVLYAVLLTSIGAIDSTYFYTVIHPYDCITDELIRSLYVITSFGVYTLLMITVIVIIMVLNYRATATFLVFGVVCLFYFLSFSYYMQFVMVDGGTCLPDSFTVMFVASLIVSFITMLSLNVIGFLSLRYTQPSPSDTDEPLLKPYVYNVV